ncbi:hypothetical protein D3C84_1285720 [compost metagenome]
MLPLPSRVVVVVEVLPIDVHDKTPLQVVLVASSFLVVVVEPSALAVVVTVVEILIPFSLGGESTQV